MVDKKKHVLAIDLGTGGVKASVVDQAGQLMASGLSSLEMEILPDGGAEQDTEKIWAAVVEACKQALAAAAVPAQDIMAVICSSQYMSVVPVDQHGTALMNMVLWLDTRGGPYNCDLYTRYPEALDIWSEIHGLPPLESGNDSLGHMLWVKNQRPQVYEKTAAFLEPADFVNLRLTGRITANQCTVFPLLLTDNRQFNVREYDQTLLAMAGIDENKLPELVDINSVVGCLLPAVAAELGLSAQTKVLAGLNDTQAGSVGTASFQGNQAGLCIGTTTIIHAEVAFKRTAIENLLVTMPGPFPGRNIVMAENGLGGKIVEHFLSEIIYGNDDLGRHGVCDIYAQLDNTVAHSRPGSGGLLFLPWLNGAYAPSANPNARGGFLNMSMETTRGDLVRAVLEGIAFNARWLLSAVENFSGRNFEHLVFAGGGAHSDVWAQIMADIMNKPIHQMADARYVNSRGTGLLALIRLGYLKEEDAEIYCEIRKIFQPSGKNRSLYDNMYEQFIQAFERNQPIFEALNAKL